jgi:hypothetical protein
MVTTQNKQRSNHTALGRVISAPRVVRLVAHGEDGGACVGLEPSAGDVRWSQCRG